MKLYSFASVSLVALALMGASGVSRKEADLSSKLAQANQTAESLQKDRDGLAQKLQSATADNLKLNTRVSVLTAQVDTLTRNLTQTQSQIRSQIDVARFQAKMSEAIASGKEFDASRAVAEASRRAIVLADNRHIENVANVQKAIAASTVAAEYGAQAVKHSEENKTMIGRASQIINRQEKAVTAMEGQQKNFLRLMVVLLIAVVLLIGLVVVQIWNQGLHAPKSRSAAAITAVPDYGRRI